MWGSRSPKNVTATTCSPPRHHTIINARHSEWSHAFFPPCRFALFGPSALSRGRCFMRAVLATFTMNTCTLMLPCVSHTTQIFMNRRNIWDKKIIYLQPEEGETGKVSERGGRQEQRRRHAQSARRVKWRAVRAREEVLVPAAGRLVYIAAPEKYAASG